MGVELRIVRFKNLNIHKSYCVENLKKKHLDKSNSLETLVAVKKCGNTDIFTKLRISLLTHLAGTGR